MKKMYSWGITLFAMVALFAFAGCNTSTSPNKGKNNGTTTAGWTANPAITAAGPGEESGQITYAFTASDPAADSYTLYYAKGEISTAQGVLDTAGVATESVASAGTHTLGGLNPNTQYTLVIAAIKSGIDNPALSNTKTATSKELNLPTGWKPESFSSFTVTTGDAAGEILYSFSAAVPEDDAVSVASYTLYYVKGNELTTAAAIIQAAETAGTKEANVTVTTENTLSGLDYGVLYSLVIAATASDPGIQPAHSAVSTETSGYGAFAAWTGFTAATGDNACEIKYTFSDTNPEADSYTLYYVKGTETEAETVIAADNKEDVAPGTDLPFTGDPDADYTLVIVATKDGYRDVSVLAKAKTKVGVFAWEDNFTAEPGDAAKEIKFSFDDTVPPAETYMLYAVIGTANVNAILAEPDYTQIVTPGTGKLVTFEAPATQFSLVIKASSPGYEDSYTDVKTINSSNLIQFDSEAQAAWKESFTVKTGNTPGEILFSFDDLDDDVEYTLYWIEDDDGVHQNNPLTVIANGEEMAVVPGSDLDFTGVPGDEYQFVIVARKNGYEDIYTGMKYAMAKKDTFTLGPQNLTAWTSTTTQAELEFSFEDSEPVADYYYLAIIMEDEDDIQTIIAGTQNGIRRLSGPGTHSAYDTEGGNNLHSLVIIAEKAGYEDAYSEVKKATTKELDPTDYDTDPTLQVAKGTAAGQIQYTIGATDPGADTYTLYYIEGESVPATTVISGGTPVDVNPGEGTLTLTPDTSYCLVLRVSHSSAGEATTVVRQIVSTDYMAFTTGVANLTASEGDEPGQIKYTFDATVPPASHYYLYWVKAADGGSLSAQGIVDLDNAVINNVNPGVSNTFTGDPDTEYRLVIEATRVGTENTIFSISDIAAATTKPLPSFDAGALSDFAPVTGGTASATIDYTFTAVTPSDGVTYTLYYTENSVLDAQGIIDGNSSRPATAGSGTVNLGDPNKTFYMVIQATKDGYLPAVSEVKQATTRVWNGDPLSDFTAAQGTAAGTIIYGFSAATAAGTGTVTHTLYSVQATTTDVAVIRAGQSQVVTAGANLVFQTQMRDTPYSFVLVASRADLPEAVSPVQNASTSTALFTFTTPVTLSASSGTAAGNISFNVGATNPAADSYELYALAGTGHSIATITTPANLVRTVNAGNNQTYTGTAGTTYSLAVVAKKADYTDSTAQANAMAALTPFTSGVSGFTAAKGTSAGQITIMFGASDPSADTYTLYARQGTGYSPADVVNATYLVQTFTTPQSSGHTFTGTEDTTYSFVIVSKKSGYADMNSAVQTQTTPPQPGPIDGLWWNSGAIKNGVSAPLVGVTGLPGVLVFDLGNFWTLNSWGWAQKGAFAITGTTNGNLTGNITRIKDDQNGHNWSWVDATGTFSGTWTLSADRNTLTCSLNTGNVLMPTIQVVYTKIGWHDAQNSAGNNGPWQNKIGDSDLNAIIPPPPGSVPLASNAIDGLWYNQTVMTSGSAYDNGKYGVWFFDEGRFWKLNGWGYAHRGKLSLSGSRGTDLVSTGTFTAASAAKKTGTPDWNWYVADPADNADIVSYGFTLSADGNTLEFDGIIYTKTRWDAAAAQDGNWQTKIGNPNLDDVIADGGGHQEVYGWDGDVFRLPPRFAQPQATATAITANNISATRILYTAPNFVNFIASPTGAIASLGNGNRILAISSNGYGTNTNAGLSAAVLRKANFVVFELSSAFPGFPAIGKNLCSMWQGSVTETGVSTVWNYDLVWRINSPNGVEFTPNDAKGVKYDAANRLLVVDLSKALLGIQFSNGTDGSMQLNIGIAGTGSQVDDPNAHFLNTFSVNNVYLVNLVN